MKLPVIFAWLRLTATLAWASPSLLQRQSTDNVAYSKNVTNCLGYALGSLSESNYGLTARLALIGTPCNAFGMDIIDLTVEVTYQSKTTLHVKIYDTAKQQFTIPESVIKRPAAPTKSFTTESGLVFNYDSSPFAFWITRRSDPDTMPIFDTRISSLPPTPIPPFNSSDPRTAFDGFPLIFEDQYLQVVSALPYGTNIYGLGEVVASSGFRRDIGTDGGVGTIQTNWAGGAPDPIDQNLYGSHPIYLEHRFNETTNASSSSGVLLLSSAGSDIFLQTPPNSQVSLIEYRLVGGILDFYFFSGPTDAEVIAQYGATIGYPTWHPAWGFGFHLCKWGYVNVSEVIANVEAMRAANIPLEVQWNDIDLYHAYRDFTVDPVRFPAEELQQFVEELTANHQHCRILSMRCDVQCMLDHLPFIDIPIVDANLPVTVNETDVYYPFSDGVTEGTFIKNPDGSIYIGQGWPGYSVFSDWFAENAQAWWTEALKNWTKLGVDFSGLWLDMNEVTSFCSYSCGTGANLSGLQPFDVTSRVVTGYPECYNETLWGPSGNMTINGASTNSCPPGTSETISKRGVGAGDEPNVNLSYPPYVIHNGNTGVSTRSAVATNATHSGGYDELDVHNMFGMMEGKATHLALQTIFKGKRPFLISRSTFLSSGRWTGHWLGDNYSKWQYMYLSIQGILQFQIYQIPMVGADTCGFKDNTDEELCNRWMQLSAFTPFYRNHNTYGALPQEPYRWDSVANASRIAIAARYSMLPYWYTLFANASTNGLPPVRALFYEFPDERELFNVDRQWLIGADILVTPVLTPGADTVDGIFPGRGSVIWRDWWTHAAVEAVSGANTTLSAPISHINVHVRDSSILLLHQEPAYTIYETRQGPYSLLVALNAAGTASGDAYVDDGESYPPGANRILYFAVSDRTLEINSKGGYMIDQRLGSITILGIQQPTTVKLNSETVSGWTYDAANEELIVSNLCIDLNVGQTALRWE